MAQHSIIENIHRNTEDWFAVKAAVRGKGVDCPDNTPTANVAGKIEDIESGLNYLAYYSESQDSFNGVDVEITGGSIDLAPISDSLTTISFCKPKLPFNFSVPSSVTTIANYAFEGSGLMNIAMYENVTFIGQSAFRDCDYLKEIRFPASVIKAYTFANCTNLEKIYINEGLTEIATDAFLNCSNLKDIYFAGSETQWQAINGINNIPSGATVHFAA